MIIYIDIDNTICQTHGQDYHSAEPLFDRIDQINQLYNNGNIIIYWTSRGVGTGIDWRDLTIYQLDTWKAKYHDIKFNKPIYDLFIDDKNINSNLFFSIIQC